MTYRQPPCHVCGAKMTAKNHLLWIWREIGYVHTPCGEGTAPSEEAIPDRTPCKECGEYLNVGDWPWCPHESTRPSHHSVHASERSVVWEHPGTGEIRYPGRNDAPIPDRYVKEGFVRKEFESLRSLETFERSHSVRNDKAHYNPGNSYDQEERSPKRMTERQKRDLWAKCQQEVR